MINKKNGFKNHFFYLSNHTKNLVFLHLTAIVKSKTFEIHITVKSETIIQRPSIRPNHFIIFIPNINNIKATINQVKFESHIADQDFLNQISVEYNISFHFFNSSLTLSNIRILASIAIQIDKISHAIEAKVRTIQKTFIIDNNKRT